MNPSAFAQASDPGAMLAEAKRLLEVIQTPAGLPLSADPARAEVELDAWRSFVLTLAHSLIIARRSPTPGHAVMSARDAGVALLELAPSFQGDAP